MSAAASREPVTRIAVDVTFLRMDAPPAEPGSELPSGFDLVRVARCSVPFYRYLYDTVGRDWVWWLRRTVPDEEIAALLARPEVTIHVLYGGGEPAGFFELERRGGEGGTNLSYFGLLPHALGRGLGQALLRKAIDTAWAEGPQMLTVNTCTADHPRALPNYVSAGFRVLRTMREIWPVPQRLGLRIPDRLRV
jgi:GNAT superfamily N-acetyltransferase